MSSSLSRRSRRRNRERLCRRQGGTQDLGNGNPFDIDAPADSGAGMFEACIVEPESMPWVLKSALAGDTKTKIILRVIGRWFADASRAKPGKGPLCLDCDFEFKRGAMPSAFAIVMPSAKSGGRAIISGVCPTCAQNDVMTIGLRRWKTIWPNLRLVSAGSSATH
jgi:hypothetical protein